MQEAFRTRKQTKEHIGFSLEWKESCLEESCKHEEFRMETPILSISQHQPANYEHPKCGSTGFNRPLKNIFYCYKNPER